MSDAENSDIPVEAELLVAVQVASWEDVDRAMSRLRDLEAAEAALDARYDPQINELQEAKRSQGEVLRVERLALEDAIAAYAGPRRGGRKSIQLTHGVLQWRRSAESVRFLHGEAYTLAAAKAQGLLAVVRLHEAVDKAALKKLSVSQASSIGVELTATERLSIKLAADPLLDTPTGEARP